MAPKSGIKFCPHEYWVPFTTILLIVKPAVLEINFNWATFVVTFQILTVLALLGIVGVSGVLKISPTPD